MKPKVVYQRKFFLVKLTALADGFNIQSINDVELSVAIG